MYKVIFVVLILIVVVVIAIASVRPSNNSESCIVTVYGNNYNVTALRDFHPGGNIFVCGTDMSETYDGEHGSNIERLEPYLVP